MTESPKPDWDPRSELVLRDQGEAYDRMRQQCPVAHSDFLEWSVFRHDDVERVLLDHETFSNAVSTRRSVPNGMDPPEHTTYRRLIERSFEPDRVEAFEPVCRQIAIELLEPLFHQDRVEYVEGFAAPFALHCQCSFVGWPKELARPLLGWTLSNQKAVLAQDRDTLTTLAAEFRGYVDEVLAMRRRASQDRPDDVLDYLLQAQVDGKPLTDEEITSVLRNWTVGEIGSITASLSTLTHHLANDVSLQWSLRANPHLLPTAVDEILRISGPLVANRRVATRDVEIGGRQISAGERITLMWISANRDELVFEDPLTVRFDRDPRANLLYGAGIHVCPGAGLARLEMRVAMEELLKGTDQIRLLSDTPPRRAVYPANGFAELQVRLR